MYLCHFACECRPAAASFLFATLLVNLLYGDEEDCKGRECFAGTFAICAITAAVVAMTISTESSVPLQSVYMKHFQVA